MDKKINLLFVSIAFPPKMDPECLQTAKYFKYLVKDDRLNIDVVTSQDKTLFMPVDENLKKYAQGYRQIIKVPFFENKYINFLMRKIDWEILQYPDSKYRFAKKWEYVLKKLHHKPDIIYSRSSPISSAIMAYRLQKIFNVPWVMHLSDPWTIDPDHHFDKSKQWNEKMEYKCFEAASVISLTSLKTIELYQKKYPQFKSKMFYSPNVFDLEDKQDVSRGLSDKIKVVFTGGLTGDRTAKHFLEAIKILYKYNPNITEDFEFIFAGALDRYNKKIFQKKIPSVKHIGLLPYRDALLLQAQADILLLIDIPFQDKDEALFFPSKLLDYMLMQKRIFAITSKDGTSWNFIHKKIGDCFEHSDIEGIQKALIDIWEKWKERDETYFFHSNLDMNYSAQNNAKRLTELFIKLVRQNKDKQ